MRDSLSIRCAFLAREIIHKMWMLFTKLAFSYNAISLIFWVLTKLQEFKAFALQLQGLQNITMSKLAGYMLLTYIAVTEDKQIGSE